jgi:hypothetical protein
VGYLNRPGSPPPTHTNRHRADLLEVFDFVDLLDLVRFWRFWLCAVPAMTLACYLHHRWPNSGWLWYLTVPGLISAVIAGVLWELKSSQSNRRNRL